jgi:hypothetical protein
MFQFTGFASLTYVFSQGYSLRSGFPHSDIYGSKLHCQLPVAFRRLARPSSPVIAKASTTCTYSLDPITLYSLARAATGNSYLCCLVFAKQAWPKDKNRCNHNVLPTPHQRCNTTFFHFVKERSNWFSPNAKDKQICLSLGSGGG